LQALWDADALTHLWTLPGLGGFVYALATSPLLPQHVAGKRSCAPRLLSFLR
jgi:hypothetical protein